MKAKSKMRRFLVMWLIHALFFLMAGMGANCAESENGDRGGQPLKVLFIGNSLTFCNDLPRMVEYLSEHATVPLAMKVDSVTVPGVTLEQHWQKGNAQKKIQQGGWDYIVLQGQSLETITNLEGFYKHARLFDAEIRKNGGKTLLYMTWALRNAPEQQSKITAAYRQIGKELGARVIPVGVARENLLKLHADAPIYVKDGKHPSPQGTYLAACLFQAALDGHSAKGLPALVPDAKNPQKQLVELTADDAKLYQKVADETLKSEP